MNVSGIVAASVLCVATRAVSAQTLTDPQIAAVVVTANQVDFDLAPAPTPGRIARKP